MDLDGLDKAKDGEMKSGGGGESVPFEVGVFKDVACDAGKLEAALGAENIEEGVGVLRMDKLGDGLVLDSSSHGSGNGSHVSSLFFLVPIYHPTLLFLPSMPSDSSHCNLHFTPSYCRSMKR